MGSDQGMFEVFKSRVVCHWLGRVDHLGLGQVRLSIRFPSILDCFAVNFRSLSIDFVCFFLLFVFKMGLSTCTGRSLSLN